jgi:hypothetical protein
MKIKEVRSYYRSNTKQLSDQIQSLKQQKEKAEKQYKITGDGTFSDEAATLQLSIDAVKKAYDENMKTSQAVEEQFCNIANMESSRQQGEAMEEYAEDLGKIMTVFRRMAHGDIVPATDEKKLSEYSDKMYTAAKNMQAMAQQLEEKERKKHKSLWEGEEEKTEYEDPTEIADNTEYVGELQDIEIPELSPGDGVRVTF